MPEDVYRCYRPEVTSTPGNIELPYLTVPDAKAAMGNIRRTGNFLSIWDGDLIPGKRYTSSTANSGKHNHFQGIRRLQNSNYLLLSGGDAGTTTGHLFVAKLSSRPEHHVWGANVLFADRPPDEDRLELALCVNDEVHGLSHEFWHVGGICSLGSLAAVPVESDAKGSWILFYDFTDPERPQLLHQDLWIRREQAQSGAVALTKLPSGQILLIVMGKHKNGGMNHLDVYLSNSADLSEGFAPTDSWSIDERVPESQCIDLIIEETGKLFLTTTRNTSGAAPIINGDDVAELFEIRLNGGDLNRSQQDNCTIESVASVGRQKFEGTVTGRNRSKKSPFRANMNAGAGMYLQPGGGLLAYCCFHWRRYRRISFVEYTPDPTAFMLETITSPDQGWVEMYEDDTYRGLRLSLSAGVDFDIPDFGKISVQGKSFNRKVSSVRYQLPPGQILRLFEDRNYDANKKFMDLIGDGKVNEIRDLKREKDFGDKVESCKIV